MNIIETLIRIVRDYNWQRITCGFVGENKDVVLSWLKSLRPQKQWKPTEKQMEALKLATELDVNVDLDVLERLYQQLKAL